MQKSPPRPQSEAFRKHEEMNATRESTCSFIHIDDDADDLFLVRYVAERSGLPLKVEQFNSARRFLEYLAFPDALAPAREFAAPAFLLMDYHLHTTDAPEVITQVRALPGGKSIPIIIYSSSQEIADAVRAYQAGANHFLTKAADLTHLKLILVVLYCGAVSGNDFSLLATLPEYRMSGSEILPTGPIRQHQHLH